MLTFITNTYTIKINYGFFDNKRYKVAKIIGPNNPPFPGAEASLDIQHHLSPLSTLLTRLSRIDSTKRYIMGIAQGVSSWFWSMGGNDWIAEWAQSVINTHNGV